MCQTKVSLTVIVSAFSVSDSQASLHLYLAATSLTPCSQGPYKITNGHCRRPTRYAHAPYGSASISSDLCNRKARQEPAAPGRRLFTSKQEHDHY